MGRPAPRCSRDERQDVRPAPRAPDRRHGSTGGRGRPRRRASPRLRRAGRRSRPARPRPRRAARGALRVSRGAARSGTRGEGGARVVVERHEAHGGGEDARRDDRSVARQAGRAPGGAGQRHRDARGDPASPLAVVSRARWLLARGDAFVRRHFADRAAARGAGAPLGDAHRPARVDDARAEAPWPSCRGVTRAERSDPPLRRRRAAPRSPHRRGARREVDPLPRRPRDPSGVPVRAGSRRSSAQRTAPSTASAQ